MTRKPKIEIGPKCPRCACEDTTRERNYGRTIVMAAIQHDDEIPCDGCNGVRALCGGMPRKDGEPR